MLGLVSLSKRAARIGTTSTLALALALALVVSSGCKEGKTSLLLELSGPSAITELAFVVTVPSIKTVSTKLPTTTHPLPGSVVIELPDVATQVTVDLTGTETDGTVHHTSAQPTSRVHRQVKVTMSLGDNDDLASTNLDGGDVDLSMTDSDGSVPPGDAAKPVFDLTAPTDFPGVATDLAGSVGPQLTVLAGNYGGPGFHDDTGTDARFDTITGITLVGTTLYVTEYWSGHLRSIDTATHVVTNIKLKKPSDGTFFPLSGPAAMTYDGAGFLYVACWNQTIYKIEIATSNATLIAGAPDMDGSADGDGATARFNRPSGLAFDASGNLWVADQWFKHIRKIATPGTTPMVTTIPLVNGDATPVLDMGLPSLMLTSPNGITFNGGMLYLADSGSVRKLDITQNPIVATRLTAADQFSAATQVAFSGGEMYVTDSSLNAIWHVPATGDPVLFAGANTFQTAWIDGTGVGARLQQPGYMVEDGAGTLYFGEPYDVRKLVVSSTVVTTIAGRGNHDGDTDGVTPPAELGNPSGLYYDGYDTLDFADADSQEVRKLELSLGKVTTIAGHGDFTFKDGLGKAARFYTPTAVVADFSGNLYVSDSNNECVRKIDSAGNVTTIVGVPQMERQDSEAVVENVNGNMAKLQNPLGLFFDGDHTLFLADSGADIVRSIDLSNSTYKVNTYLGSYKHHGPKDGIGMAAGFDRPAAFAYDSARELLYIAESNSQLIRKVDISNRAMPNVTTLSGVAYSCGMTVGGLDATQYCSPTGLAITPDGNELFVANQDGGTVVRLDLVAMSSKIVVGAFKQNFVRPGPLATARLSNPTGLAVTPYGLIISSLSENVLLLATGVF